MSCRTTMPIAAIALWLFTCGCQTVPPEPLHVHALLEEIQQRPVAIEPIQSYAARLAEGGAVSSDDGLTLPEAEAVALWYNADLRVARLEAERSGALARTAGRWNDPELELSNGAKWFDGPVDTSWIGAGSLSITVPLSGRPRLERRARSAEHGVALIAVAEAEWRALLDLRETWIRWSAAVESQRLLDDYVAIVAQFAGTTRDLADAGEVDFGTARLFSLEHIRKLAQRDAFAAEAVRLRTELLYIMGLSAGAPVTLVDAIPAVENDGADTTDETVLNHPAVLRASAEYDAAEARLRVEVRRQYPDITLSPGFNTEPGETALVVGLGFPIPAWNTNRQGIAEARAQRDIQRVRVEQALHRAEIDIAQSDASLHAAQARSQRLTRDAAPEVDALVSKSTELLRAGEADFGVLFQALTQAFDVKQEILTAAMDEQIARARRSAFTNPIWPIEGASSETGENKSTLLDGESE